VLNPAILYKLETTFVFASKISAFALNYRLDNIAQNSGKETFRDKVIVRLHQNLLEKLSDQV